MRDAAIEIVKALHGAGYTAYFAGGCVRDGLMGVEPGDYDIATNATPDDVRKIFPDCKEVGAHFGVMIVRRFGADFEIATFRQDGSYEDGRHPESVEFSSPQEDAKRRDFTINGLFYDPVAEEIIDFVGGQEDLKKQTLRAIGDPGKRFAEDHLRLMRAVRFATTLGFEIDPVTWQAIIDHAPHLQSIAIERTRIEFEKILVSPNRLRGFDLLVKSGLMRYIIPEIFDLQGCEQPPQFHPEGDVFEHVRIMLDLLDDKAGLPVVLSVLLHDIGKPATYSYDEEAERIRFNGHAEVGAKMADEILHRLKFPNAVIEATVEAVAQHMVFKDVQHMRVSRLKRFMARPHFEGEMELHRVDCLSSNGLLDNYQFIRDKQEEFAKEPIIPPPLVNGKDLLEEGWKPGPEMGKLLREIQTLQLEGTLSTREQALEWLRTEYKAQ